MSGKIDYTPLEESNKDLYEMLKSKIVGDSFVEFKAPEKTTTSPFIENIGHRLNRKERRRLAALSRKKS